MDTTLETRFRAWAERHRYERPEKTDCETQRDELIALQGTCDGFVTRFESILERWKIRIEEPKGYQDLKAAAKQRESMPDVDETFAVESLSWKDRDFARHVVQRYKRTTEGQRTHRRATGPYIKQLAKCSTLMDEDEFRRRANSLMFLRHKHSFENERMFSKSLGNKSSSFLQQKEMVSILDDVKHGETVRSTGIGKVPGAVLDEMSSWIESGLITSHSSDVIQSLMDVEPTAYSSWMLRLDDFGFLIADASPEKVNLFMTPASSVRPPAVGDSEATPLSSVSPSAPVAERQEVRPESSHSSASSLSEDSLSGQTIAASEAAKDISYGVNLDICPQFSQQPQPGTMEISLSEHSSSTTEVEPSTGRQGSVETAGAPETPNQSSEGEATVVTSHEHGEVARILCGRLARAATENIVGGILWDWKGEALRPGASQLCLQRCECICGPWAEWAPPAALTRSATTDFDVVKCTPVQMRALAKYNGRLTKACVMQPLDGTNVGGRTLWPVDPYSLDELQLLGGMPGEAAPPLVVDVAQAPDWPLAACTEARFGLLEDLIRIVTASDDSNEPRHGRGCSPFSHVSGGQRGGFMPPTKYDWCGVWIRLAFGNAILSIQSHGDQDWKNIYLTSGCTVYVPCRVLHAITFLTYCTICKYVTWDSVDLLQGLEDMASAPTLPVELPNHMRSYLPDLIQALARPEGRQCLVNRAGRSPFTLISTLALLNSKISV